MAIPRDICFLAGTLGRGGAERQLFYMLKVLRQDGAAVRLLSLTQGEFWENRIRKLGVMVTCVGQPRSRLARLAGIIRALRDRPPDVIQSQHFFTNLYAVAAARALGVREVGAIRSDALAEVRRHKSVVGSLSLRAPRLIAANSRCAIGNAIKLGVREDRIRFLPNVVDVEEFRPGERNGFRPVRLMSAGRLVREKRHDRFLSVLACLKHASSRPFRAIVTGDGPLRKNIERQASELGLSSEVLEFKGEVQDMSSAYQQADILVLTSDYEGTPNVILEAMASGLAVVATGVGGVPEIVQHGETGFVVPCGRDEMIVEAILRLTSDEALRLELGHRARRYVEVNHSLERLPEYLEKLYEKVFS